MRTQPSELPHVVFYLPRDPLSVLEDFYVLPVSYLALVPLVNGRQFPFVCFLQRDALLLFFQIGAK